MTDKRDPQQGRVRRERRQAASRAGLFSFARYLAIGAARRPLVRGRVGSGRLRLAWGGARGEERFPNGWTEFRRTRGRIRANVAGGKGPGGRRGAWLHGRATRGGLG